MNAIFKILSFLQKPVTPAGFCFFLPFTVGSSFSGTFTYELSAIDEFSGSAQLGRYSPATYEWDLGGGNVFREEPLGLGKAYVSDQGFSDVFAIQGGMAQSQADGHAPTKRMDTRLPSGWKRAYSGNSVQNNQIVFTDFDSTNLTSDAAPSPLPLTGWDSIEVFSTILVGNPLTYTTPLGSHVGLNHEIRGSITSVTIVPEPGTAILLSLAGLGLVCRRRITR